MVKSCLELPLQAVFLLDESQKAASQKEVCKLTDEFYMKQALSLAKKGCGWVSPNPMVGAVIVKNNRIIGSGFHQKYGGPHAERNALAACGESPAGASMYVTLEPCCHHGKTGPCTQAIIQSRIRRVVLGSKDPNPLVCGKGIELLRQAGILVTTDVLREECDRLNTIFFHFIRTKTPYVTMKYAMTADGKIATAAGDSKWITGDKARLHVHQTRHQYSGIMAGVGTVLLDDPLLTCRLPASKNPLRIICDTHLRTPLKSRLVSTAGEIPTLLATCCTDTGKIQPYLDTGCEVLTIPSCDGHVDLKVLIRHLGARGIDSVLLEGGMTLNWSALKAGIVKSIQTYIAPKIVGGAKAKSPIGGEGIQTLSQAWTLTPASIQHFGDDLLLESEVVPCSPES